MPRDTRPFLILLLFIFSWMHCAGQDSSRIARGMFGIGTGYAYSALKNETFSPLIQSGSGLPVQVFYRQSTAQRKLHGQFYYSSLSLTSDFDALTTDEQNYQFQFADHYRLGKRQRKITTWVGFVIDAQAVQRSFSSPNGNGSAGNNSSDEGFFSFNPSVLFENKIRNNAISLQIWFSAVAYVIWPAKGIDQIDSKVMSIGSFSKTEARLSYSKYLSPRWEGRIDGQFQFYALTIDQTLYKINSQVIASIAYKL